MVAYLKCFTETFQTLKSGEKNLDQNREHAPLNIIHM